MTKYRVCVCVCVPVHTYITSTSKNTRGYISYILQIMSTHSVVCARVLPYVCLCICELACLHIPGPPKPWIISFTLTCPKDELENQHRLTSLLLTWLPVSISGWMKPELPPSEDLLSPVLCLSLPPSPCSVLFFPFLARQLSTSCPSQVNLFHMTLRKGPSAKVQNFTLEEKLIYADCKLFVPIGYRDESRTTQFLKRM